MTTVLSKNKSIAQSYLDAVSRGDADAAARLFAVDGKIQPQGRTLLKDEYVGREEIGDVVRQITGVFPEGLKMAIKTMTEEDDRLSVEAVSYGVHVSGRIYDNKYNFLITFANEEITEVREYFDTGHTTDVIFGGKNK